MTTTNLRLVTGIAKVRCGGCGTQHQSEQLAFAPATGDANSYCETCARTRVHQEERDLVAALNTIDLAICSAKVLGRSNARVEEMIGTLRDGVDHIARRYRATR